MQIACPACQTRYSLPDGAIGPEGRTVRCAKCRHSWFEAGPGAEEAPAAPEAPQPEVPAREAPPVPPAPTTGGWDDVPEQPVSASAPPSYDAPPTYDAPAYDARAYDAPDYARPPEPPVPPAPSFDGGMRYEPAAEPTFERPETPPQPMPGTPEPYAENADEAWPDVPEFDGPADTPMPATAEHVPAPPAPEMPAAAYEESEWDEYQESASRKSKLRLILVILLVLAAVAAAAFFAVRHYGAPAWLPMGQVAFAPASKDLQLEFPVEDQDRRKLENGLQYFAASGTVTNTGRQTQYVPDVQVVLRDAQERVVYSWELEPPKRKLAPGETLTINEAVTDVPASARVVEIGWKAG